MQGNYLGEILRGSGSPEAYHPMGIAGYSSRISPRVARAPGVAGCLGSSKARSPGRSRSGDIFALASRRMPHECV
jgi:hypothetical protein